MRCNHAGTCVGLAAAIAAARFSWSAVLAAYGTPARFSLPIDPADVLRLLSGADTGYRRQTLQRLLSEFFGANCPLGTTNLTLFGHTVPAPGATVSYFALFCALLALLFFAAYRGRRSPAPEDAEAGGGASPHIPPTGPGFGKKGSQSQDCTLRARRIRLAWVVFAGVLLYLAGLAGLYLFKFYSFEALELWCFDRYIGVPLLLLGAFMIMLFLSSVQKRLWFVKTAVLALCMAALCPLQNAKTYLTRASAKGSAEMLAPDVALAARITDLAGDARRVFLISQGGDGEGIALNYLLYPRKIDGASIGPKWYIDDPFARDITADQWRVLLVRGGYQYVVLDRLNDHFFNVCASAFAEPETIASGAIYRVDTQTGMLTRVP